MCRPNLGESDLEPLVVGRRIPSKVYPDPDPRVASLLVRLCQNDCDVCGMGSCYLTVSARGEDQTGLASGFNEEVGDSTALARDIAGCKPDGSHAEILDVDVFFNYRGWHRSFSVWVRSDSTTIVAVTDGLVNVFLCPLVGSRSLGPNISSLIIGRLTRAFPALGTCRCSYSRKRTARAI